MSCDYCNEPARYGVCETCKRDRRGERRAQDRGVTVRTALVEGGRQVGNMTGYRWEHAATVAEARAQVAGHTAWTEPPLFEGGAWRVFVRWSPERLAQLAEEARQERQAQPVELPGLERQPAMFEAI